MQKNVSGQKWIVFAFDRTDNSAKTGDAANITANLRIDGGAANAVDDTNPTELEDGYYIFDITQAESNGDYILICPVSSTSNIQVIGCPAAIWTVAPYHNVLSIDANGRIDVIKVAGTTQTANDNGADINSILTDTAEIGTAGAGLTDLGGMSTGMKGEINAEADTALSDYDPPTRAELTTDKNSIITEINANETKIDALNDIAASDVWDATVNETTAGATPTTAKGKLQAIWNFLIGPKRAVTSSLETAYEKDGSTTMETWDLADDDTTASRTA